MKLHFLSISHLKNETQRVVNRFPLTSMIVLAATIISCIMITFDYKLEKQDNLAFLLVVLALGIPLSISFHLLAENPPAFLQRFKKWLPLLALPLLTAYYAWLELQPHGSNTTRYFQWFLYCHLLVAIAPFFKSRSDKEFWNFNYQIFIAFLISRFFSLFLFAGLSLALVSIKSLLEFNIDNDAYGYLFVICMFLIASIHFLALIPVNMQALEESQTPKLLKIFCQYILVPLNVAYILILYSYMIKIIFTGVWPQGTISWLVIGISILGVFALLMMHVFQQNQENQWMKKFQTWYYASIIPLLILGLMAIYQRVGQYSITENRYILSALNLWLLGIAIYFLASKRKKIIVIPVSLFVLTLTTSFGPWGLYQTSVRSQTSRLVDLLEKNNLLHDEKLTASKNEISSADYKEIRAAMVYILEQHGADNLPEAFDTSEESRLGNVKYLKHYQIQGEVDLFLQDAFTVSKEPLPEVLTTKTESFNYYNNYNGGALGNDLLLLPIEIKSIKAISRNNKTYETSIDRESLILTVKENDSVIISWQLEPLLNEQRLKNSNDAVAWNFKNDKFEAYLLPTNVYTVKLGKKYSELQFDGKLIVKFLK
jgi:hypothetical protein